MVVQEIAPRRWLVLPGRQWCRLENPSADRHDAADDEYDRERDRGEADTELASFTARPLPDDRAGVCAHRREDHDHEVSYHGVGKDPADDESDAE